MRGRYHSESVIVVHWTSPLPDTNWYTGAGRGLGRGPHWAVRALAGGEPAAAAVAALLAQLERCGSVVLRAGALLSAPEAEGGQQAALDAGDHEAAEFY